MPTSYEVCIPAPDGSWVRVGPLHDSMTAATLWAHSRSYIHDYRILPTTGDDD